MVPDREKDTENNEADGGTINQKYCHVSESSGKVTLLLELRERRETGTLQTIPVQPMSHTHAEGDSLTDEELLQRPCTQLAVHGGLSRICKISVSVFK
jgi:hypothetical protein